MIHAGKDGMIELPQRARLSDRCLAGQALSVESGLLQDTHLSSQVKPAAHLRAEAAGRLKRRDLTLTSNGHFPLCGSHTVPSCLKESAVPLLRPPTSAPQKQSPAFSTQMEVTPYASQPLSLCQGSQACARLSNNEEAREENG
ncbi:hypothetical protein Q8A67_024534 [Cirrhinus molitorella]|uniref:Uncharacterized protein n=1 Tax=Cirrhinus molitorella TaxID=172907 RepID=A0AA88NYP1_9TELE|nr:hypothetical protein Q8A67_024534 [Cirrhinus molitorella]